MMLCLLCALLMPCLLLLLSLLLLLLLLLGHFQALVDVLQEGGAAELINLDLRGNDLSEHAQQLLVSNCIFVVQRLRQRAGGAENAGA